MKRISEFIYIGCGGFLGAVSRFYVSDAAHRIFGSDFPYGTLTVNAVGSLLLGFVSYFAVHRELIGDNLRLAIAIGFLGAFTTFSTFSYDTFSLLKDGSYYLSMINIATNIVLCLSMVFFGFSAGILIEKLL